MQQVASGRVGFGVGQASCPVLLPVDGGYHDICVSLVLNRAEGKGSGLIPLVNGLGGSGAQGRVAEVNVDGGTIFRPAPVGQGIIFFCPASRLLLAYWALTCCWVCKMAVSTPCWKAGLPWYRVISQIKSTQ